VRRTSKRGKFLKVLISGNGILFQKNRYVYSYLICPSFSRDLNARTIARRNSAVKGNSIIISRVNELMYTKINPSVFTMIKLMGRAIDSKARPIRFLKGGGSDLLEITGISNSMKKTLQ
jgi:hypothetical protein